MLLEEKDLHNMHVFMTSLRIDKYPGTNVLQQQFEMQPITLYRLNEENKITTYQQPFKVAVF